jgi:hypothetical protein
MGEIHGAIFGMLIYGSFLLSLPSLVVLPVCGLVVLAGRWNAAGFRKRWVACRKWVCWASLPIVVFLASCFALDCYRSYPNGYKIVYMNSSACYMCRGTKVVIDEHIIERSLTISGDKVAGRLGSEMEFTLDTNTGDVVYTGTPLAEDEPQTPK